MGRNRHPVDELADVRAEVKKLKARETELVAEIGKLMGEADHLGGDEYIATQSISERKGYTVAASTVVSLRLTLRAAEAA